MAQRLPEWCKPRAIPNWLVLDRNARGQLAIRGTFATFAQAEAFTTMANTRSPSGRSGRWRAQTWYWTCVTPEDLKALACTVRCS